MATASLFQPNNIWKEATRNIGYCQFFFDLAFVCNGTDKAEVVWPLLTMSYYYKQPLQMHHPVVQAGTSRNWLNLEPKSTFQKNINISR